MSPLLRMTDVSKAYGRGARVLESIDLNIAPGEFVILIGGSGSGKTTLLRLVGGLEQADAGVVLLRGEVVDDPARRRFAGPERRRLGMVFQDYALWPHMSCLDNVEVALAGRGRGPGGRRTAALALLEEVGVGDLGARRPAQLSGGQQQRVGLARALAAAPDLLLLDEPLCSLDVDVRERLRERIRALVRARGGAALFVSHDPVDAWRLADRVVVLDKGRIIQAAPPETLYARPATARIARFTDAAGGFQVRLLRHGGRVGFLLGETFQTAQPFGVAEAERACIYIRPCGVRLAPEGEPAQLIDRTFEAGGWRALWRLNSCGWTLRSLEVRPPPAATRLVVAPEHTFAYRPEEETA